jgi:hypothetical protein
MFRMNHPKRVMLRTVCGIRRALRHYAFTTIPLAEVYAHLPRPSWSRSCRSSCSASPSAGGGFRRWGGFVGMLLVKPGSASLSGHLAAAGVAGRAISMIIMR